MSIKIITGNTFDIVAKSVYDEIAKNSKSGGKHCLIVPDQFALMSEKEVLEYLGLASSFDIEVASFSRLATKYIKDKTKKRLNAQTSVILLKKLIYENASSLKAFGKVAKNDGAIREIYAVITNLRNSKITPEQLKNAVKKMPSVLGNKLVDIAFLYELYIKELALGYSDVGSELEILKSEIKDLPDIKNTHIYIADFYEITRVKLDIINEYIKHAKGVTIGVVDNPEAKNERLYPRFLIDFALKSAKEQGIYATQERKLQSLDAEREILLDRLFSYRQHTAFEGGEVVEILRANSIADEVKQVARKIRQMVVEKNFRYKDFSIVCPDIEKYKRDIQMQFYAFEIPYYIDDKIPLASIALAKLFTTATKAVIKNYRKEEVIAFAKNILLDISYDEANSFELYVNKYNINYSRFLVPFEIAKEDKLFEKAEQTRAKIVEYLSFLDIKENQSPQFIVGKIKDFLASIQKNKSYQEYLMALQSVGEARAQAEGEVGYNNIINILEQTASILQGPYSSEEIFEIIIATIASSSVAITPQFVDTVFVGLAERSKFSGTKIMFMLGANDGYYPKESAGLGIIATTELESLAEQGIEFFPDNAESNKLNKFYITQLFARAKEKVFVTFNNELGEQSVLVTQLQRILNIPIEMALGDGNQKSMEIAEYASKIGTKRNAKQEMAIYYGERMNGINEGEEKIFDYLFSCLEGEFNYQNLIKSKNNKAVKPNTLAWSKSGNQTFARISAVEGYFNCPFKFFCENTLKLKDNEKGDLSVALIGSFVHKVMELFFADNSNLGLEGEELRLFVLNLCECIIKEKDFEYIAYAYSKKTLENTLFKKACYLVDKIAQVAKRSDFKTCATELSFGLKNSKLPAYELKASDGKSYFFRGEIDRVDSYGNYVALLDYKSKSGMNYGLKEIYYGERVQLLIYLNAYMANFDQEPFALLYMPMPYKYDKYEKEKKPFQYVGLVRNMEDAIEHFDREYKGKSQVLPLKLKKDGSLDDKNLLSKEQLDILREYADKVTAQAIEEIENGYIEAKPKSCNYCKFGAICGAKNNPLKARKTNGSVDFEKGTTCD